jgi:predicted DNA-binding transcriptional regulator YafY
MGWNFHPTQTLTREPDGSVLVRFRAGGMRELAWHLFTWRDQIQILAPERLKETMREELWLAMVAHLDGAGLAGWIDKATRVS